MSGVHPEAPASWRTCCTFTTPLATDLAYANTLVISGSQWHVLTSLLSSVTTSNGGEALDRKVARDWEAPQSRGFGRLARPSVLRRIAAGRDGSVTTFQVVLYVAKSPETSLPGPTWSVAQRCCRPTGCPSRFNCSVNAVNAGHDREHGAVELDGPRAGFEADPRCLSIGCEFSATNTRWANR